MTSVRRALAETYLKYRQGLFTLAMSITRRADRAEDAVHDAFERLLRRRRDETPSGDIVPYVFAAVRNAAIDITRRRATPERPDSMFVDETPGPVDLAGRAEQQELVRQAVELLPDAQREVVVLRTYAGLTFEQVAQALDRPPGTVVAQYRRGLERLKRHCRSLL